MIITKWGTKKRVLYNTSQIPEIPYAHSDIFLETIDTACRWSERPAKKYILSITKVVNFEATSKFWGIEDLRKRCKERTLWKRSKPFPVGVDVVARYYFSIYFCASSSSCCCIIVARYQSLMIICSFSSIFCTLYSSSRWSAKARWEYMGELIYHFFGTYFLRSIFDRQFRKVVLLVLQQCSKDCVVIGGRSKPFVDIWPYMGVLSV